MSQRPWEDPSSLQRLRRDDPSYLLKGNASVFISIILSRLQPLGLIHARLAWDNLGSTNELYIIFFKYCHNLALYFQFDNL